MSKMFYYKDEDEDDDDNIMRDGEVVRVPLYMKNSMGNVLCDANGRPLPAGGRRSGYVFSDTRVADRADRYAQHRDFQKAELASRWRGGFQEGDFLKMGDRDMCVTGHNPDNGKVLLSDASQLNAEAIKREAYDAYNHDITNAWRTRPTVYSWDKPGDDDKEGAACVASGAVGQWRRDKDGKLVCVPNSDNEFALAGPLSDSQVDAIRRDAWLELVEALQNAWRR